MKINPNTLRAISANGTTLTTDALPGLAGLVRFGSSQGVSPAAVQFFQLYGSVKAQKGTPSYPLKVKGATSQSKRAISGTPSLMEQVHFDTVAPH